MKLFGYEFTIKKVKKKSISRRSWTASEINTMLRLRNEGHNWASIGELMNRTSLACSNKYGKVRHERNN